mmetsp:Transcript_40331/g.94769  ORF Transcript_40331/g.94769 Transcript_40331/m.94769 type:complete len:213 (+) Transcript_40331:888-1526(+)
MHRYGMFDHTLCCSWNLCLQAVLPAKMFPYRWIWRLFIQRTRINARRTVCRWYGKQDTSLLRSVRADDQKKKKSAPEMTEKTFSISHLLRRKDSAIASEEQKVAPTKTLDNNTSGREMRHGMSSWGGHFDAWVRRASVSKTGKFIPETVFKKDIDWKEKAGKEGHTEMTSPPISKLSNDMCVNGSRSEILGDDWNPQSDFICMFGAQQKCVV